MHVNTTSQHTSETFEVAPCRVSKNILPFADLLDSLCFAYHSFIYQAAFSVNMIEVCVDSIDLANSANNAGMYSISIEIACR